MKNIEKIRAMSANELAAEMKRLMGEPLSDHIDYAAWLESSDEDTSHFLMSEVDNPKAVYLPPELEMTAFKNESRLANGREPSPEEINKAMKDKTHECYVLRKTVMFGRNYWEVVDFANNRIVKVPCERVVFNAD